MTREQIEARLAQLRNDLQQIYANANAVSGAIQDCEYWLAQLDTEDKFVLDKHVFDLPKE